MEVENLPHTPLERSKTDGKILISGSGINGPNFPSTEFQRARTELVTPASSVGSSRGDFDVDRVLYEISRKVLANKKSLLYLFRNNDPAGRGSITREALHRIMRVLYGFLTSDQFGRLLRRMNIHNRSQVTYDVFMACFEDAEPLQKRYLRRQLLEPFWRAASSGQDDTDIDLIDGNNERKYLDVATGMERSRSADDRIISLKRRILDVMPSVRASFPSEGPNDLLLSSKMLRKVLEKAGVNESVEDANVLWDRLDTARCGLVPLRRFYTFIDPLSDNSEKSAPSGQKSFPAPTRSQMVPRLAVGSKSAAGGATRSLGHYRYPPAPEKLPETGEKSAETAQAPTAHPPRPLLPHMIASQHLNKGVAPSTQKRALLLDNEKPVLLQLVNRLVEPREQFMTFCRRFDDEHGSGRIALGQLLGCLLFCGKTVPDTFVSQLVQKLGVKCASDDSATSESGESKKYDYRSLGCSMYDPDSNRLLANVLQNSEHYFRLLRSDLCSDWCETEPSNYETVEVKFMKFMYNDIIRLITELRRLDRGNSGIVSEKDFEIAMARIFNTTFSRKQLVELVKGALTDDGSGGIVIAEFIKSMFATAQPEICRILLMSSSTNKRQASTTKTPAASASTGKEAVATIPEQPTEQSSAQHLTYGLPTEMNEEEAIQMFKNIMKDRFHSFDKHFLTLDVKQTKRISQFQLHQILRNMNVHLSMRELGYMWKYVPTDPDGLCSYRRFLLHFITANGGNNSHAAIKLNANNSNKPANENAPPTGNTSESNEGSKELARQADKTPGNEIDEVLECIRADVCRKWGILKERIRLEDAAGLGNFETDRLMSVIKGSGIEVTDEAMSYISKKFTSVERNRRRFFYMPFMRYFTRRFAQETNNGVDHKCECKN